jgi:GAF domain-containing protein/HAMP domain-containing protein
VETSDHTSATQRRVYFLKALTTFVPIVGIVSAIGYLVIFFISNAWQMLAAAALAVLGSGIFLSTGPLIQKRRISSAAIILLTVGVALVPLYALFWSGISIELIVLTWCISLFIAWFGLERNYQLITVPIVSLIATLAILLVDRKEPIVRQNITDINLLRWLIPLVVILGGALLFLIFTRGIRTVRLANRMLPAFLLIVLIPIVILSASSIFSAQESDRRYAVDSLENFTTARESEIKGWVTDLQVNLQLAAQTDQILTPMISLLSMGKTDSNFESTRFETVTQFNNVLNQTNLFQEIILMNNDGVVLADTIQNHEGLSAINLPLFVAGKTKPAAITSRLIDQQTSGAVSIFISLPVADTSQARHGQIVGVLAGRANIGGLEAILGAQASQPNISTYLVNRDYTMIYSSGAQNSHTGAAVEAINTGINGSLFYLNQNIPVVSVYHWVPGLGAVLITEMPQSLIFTTLRSVVTTNILIALISATIAILGALFTIRTLSTPLSNLELSARNLAAGDLTARATVEEADEIGVVANAFNDMAGKLKNLVTNLEDRVAERTRDLETRSIELRTAAQIARDASLAQNTEDLLSHTTRLIRERFGFYHVGIFLIDDNGEFAVLRAAGGEAGQLLLANKHKLKVGEVGIVGFVAKTGDPRIALDVGADAVHFKNPLLPYTRSEMALPLKLNERLIGVLDIQSDKVNAFNQDDITIMQILTDQVSVSIERTRLLQELERNAGEMEQALQEYTSRGWRSLLQQGRKNQGYRYEGINIEPVFNPPPENLKALTAGTSVIIKGDHGKPGNILAVPIRLRGQTLGTLNLRFQGNEIPTESIKLIEEAAGRLALALENARLVQEAQRLARRERQINVISAQVQQSTDLETVLLNTIRELGNTLDVPKTFIQIGFLPPEKTKKKNDEK